MNLDTALEQIATFLSLDADALKAFAREDTFTGWDNGAGQFPNGSIWQPEGQILYALVRALKPASALELGVYHGASSTHLIAALQVNGKGKLTSVDHHSGDSGAVEIGDAIPAEQKSSFHFVEKRAQHYLEALDDHSLPFIWEDAQHDVEGTSEIWSLGMRKLQPCGVIVSHDAMHPTAGPDVRAGIAAAGIKDALYLLIEPSDCGLAIYRKPRQVAQERLLSPETVAKLKASDLFKEEPPPTKKPTAKRIPAKKVATQNTGKK